MKKQPQKKEKLQVEVNLKDRNDYHFVKQCSNAFFPYQPYPQQIEIVKTIQAAIRNKENALIQSPTGTGKTICLLVGALSSLVDTQGRKKVFYLTRTHSQISQVVSQFKKTVYSCHINIVASKEQLCINHNLSKLKGKQLQKACQDLCAQKLCPYREFNSTRRPKQILDLQEFKEYGRKELACPYFYSKQLTQKSQLTILPFNYLLDWSLLERSSLDIKEAVIIFDQAHNIDSLCEQGSDIRLTHDSLSLALAELRAVVKSQNSKSLHPQFREKAEDRQLTLGFKQQIEQLTNRLKQITEVEILSRHDILHKFEQFTTTAREVGIDLGNYGDFLAKGKKVIKFAYRKEIGCQNIKFLLIIVEKMYQMLASQSEFSKFAITISKTQLFFRCLDPSLCFNRIMNCKPKSVILSSGTLGDLESWEKSLKLKFQHKISAQSFVTEHHLYAQIRQKSQKGVSFNFSFQGRQNDQQYTQLAKELSKLEDIIEGGIVVAFSTYDLLERTLSYCSLLKGKVFYQTKGSNIDYVYDQYRMALATSTAFLFIVMKGRFSEGINFTAELCRCLIVVGIPFLPLKDPAVVEKMKYLQATGTKQQAQEWYSQQSFKALNQTLGRAIRNKSDYAVILLFDQRYVKEEYINKLSRWFSKCMRPIKNTNQDIVAFMSKTSEKIKQINSRAKTSSKPKKQLNLCQRLAEFSTPSKANKGRKLKLIMESDEKPEFKTALKELTITEEPQYETMKGDQQEYFINFDEFAFNTGSEPSQDQKPVQLTTVRHSFRKYDNIDF